MKKLSFVIPCYGSELTLEEVIRELIDTVHNKSEYEYEIILVNDCSPDNVSKKINLLCQKYNNIISIDLARNFGQHAALMAGYSYCTGEIIISLDDDGQTPIDEVFSLIDKLSEGYDVVYGSFNEKKHNSFRNFGSHINDLMAEVLIDKPKDLKVSSYFVARKFIIDEILKYKNSYPYILGLILRSTRNICDVQVNHRRRIHGTSGYSFKKLLSLWLNGFTAFSVKPLRSATIIGFICALIGFLFGSYTVIHKLLNPSTPAGYSSIMAVILFIGGMIMLMLGLIGEYIGRIYISINNSPQYVIRETKKNNEL
ncbi:Undecaprenyl-phosphate 4-deoxy-4-formamido-L-arabinose transferase [anaerobic digester metagenome]